MTNLADRSVYLTYCLTALLDDEALRWAIEQLSSEERSRRDRFMFERDQRDFAVAHALLRRELAKHGDRPPKEWTFTSNTYGKPALPDEITAETHLSCNLAHTNGLVACAVAHEASLGVDVEAIDRRIDPLSIADRFFAPAEVAALERCSESERTVRFVEIWTLKEAYVKAVGDGLSLPLNDFWFVFDGPSSLRFDATTGSSDGAWQFALFTPSPNHRMAIAIHDTSADQRQLVVRASALENADPTGMLMPIRSSNGNAVRVMPRLDASA
jgi:4'-phosphopantetheinyl transferase